MTHALVAADGPCLVVQVGARPARSFVYPLTEFAQRHGAGVERETSSVVEAYGERRRRSVPYAAGSSARSEPRRAGPHPHL